MWGWEGGAPAATEAWQDTRPQRCKSPLQTPKADSSLLGPQCHRHRPPYPSTELVSPARLCSPALKSRLRAAQRAPNALAHSWCVASVSRPPLQPGSSSPVPPGVGRALGAGKAFGAGDVFGTARLSSPVPQAGWPSPTAPAPPELELPKSRALCQAPRGSPSPPAQDTEPSDGAPALQGSGTRSVPMTPNWLWRSAPPSSPAQSLLPVTPHSCRPVQPQPGSGASGPRQPVASSFPTPKALTSSVWPRLRSPAQLSRS